MAELSSGLPNQVGATTQLIRTQCPALKPHSISIQLENTTNDIFQPKNTATMVKTHEFGDIQVPVPGFGAMGISFGLGNNLTLEQAEPVLLKALELGCTFWDTAVRILRS